MRLCYKKINAYNSIKNIIILKEVCLILHSALNYHNFLKF